MIFPNRSRNLFLLPLTLACLLLAPSIGLAEEPTDQSELLRGRSGNRWRVPVAGNGSTRIPRVCASLRAAYFEGEPTKTVTVQPEIDHWELRYRGEPAADHIVLEFDSVPETPAEVGPIPQSGDGTLTLPCSRGITESSVKETGSDKLRFEPQPHKNTIGYWTVATDRVSWPVTISQPGAFNVGLLQGAGKVGGGTARASLIANGTVVDSFEFEVEVTGHFQNFRWRHVGVLTADQAGEYTIRIEPVEIPKAALMDVRQVHLSPKR